MPQERSQDSQDSLEQGREDNSPSGHVYEIVRPRPYSPANGAYYDSLSDVSDSSTDSSAGGAALHPESWPTSNGNSESHHITDEEDDERKAPSAVSGSPPRSSQTSFRSNIDKRPYLMEGSGELSDDALSEPEHPQRSFATFVENAEDEEDLSPWKIFESDKLPTDDFRQEGSSMSSRMTKRVSASNFSSLPDISIHKRPHGFSYGSEKGKHIANPLVSSYSIPPSSRMASRGSTNSNFSASAEMLPGERPYHARHRGPKGKGIATSSASTNTLSWSSWTSDGETKPRMRRRTRKYRDQEVRGTRTPSPDTSQRTRLRKRFDHRRSTKRSSHQSSYGDNGFSNGQPVYGNYSDEANPSFYSASRHQDRQYGATGQGYWGNGALGSSYPPYNRNNYFSGSPYTRAPYPSHFGGAYTPHQYPDPIYPQYPPMNSRPWSTLPTTQPDIELAPGKKINTERADAPSPLVDDQNEKSAHATSSMGLYKPPISCDSAAHEMSVEVSLKSSHPDPIVQETLIASIHSAAKKEIQTVWVNEKSTNVLPRGGISSLTSAMAIEHYADGLGQDKINMITAHPVSSPFATNQMETMQWLHLEQATLCLSDLIDLVATCRFLDVDYMALALRLLQVECPKFEKRFTNGNRVGYYIEPGTVLRCDSQYGDGTSGGEKSVYFCSAPYLHLDENQNSVGATDTPEKFETDTGRIHRTRTLLESLYDYDLMDERDSRQVIRNKFGSSMLCVPQVWYLLCGSNVLITCSQASSEEIGRFVIQKKPPSTKNLIATVTDLDKHQFTLALNSSDSYFAILNTIESRRSNIGGNSIIEYQICLEGGDVLTPKKWLDIVKLDPLPSLKLSLKSFEERSDNSWALAVIAKPQAPTVKHDIKSPMEARLYGDALTSESDQNDDDALIAGKSNPRPSTQLMKPRYANTAVGDPREMGLVKGDEMYEESDHSSDLMQEETAFSKEKEERRRIAALHSQGIVVYDPISVRSEPEIFDWKTAPSQSRQKVSKDRELCVWDYLIEDVDVSKVVENDFKEFLHQGNPVPAHETGSNPQGSGLSTAFSTDVEAENVHRNAHRQTKSTIQTQDTRYSKNPDDTDSVPFLQWQAGEPSGIVTNNDYDMVIRVLDGVNEELFNSNVTAHHKYYRKSNQNTFRDLEGYRNILLDTTHPFHANLEEDLPESSRAGAARVHADKIMVWRRKETTELKLRFCSVVTRLVENFLPIDLEHETMKRLRGRMLTLFEAMDQIFLTETAATNSLYYVQLDYENDDDLQQYFLLNRPKRTFKGCENCSDRGYKTLEDGVAHLRSEHFDYALDMDGQVAGRSISVYLRTLSQIQVETRVGTIMSLMRTTESMLEDIFGRVDILKKGATSLRRSGERKQYPVMAKLVKVFGLVVLLIVLMGHFGVTVDKLLRRSIHNIQDGKKLLAKQVRSLRHVHHTAIKQLDGARVDLILASKTESWSGGVTVTSIGPEFMIALMSKRLFLRQLRDGPSDEEPQRAAVDTLEVYKQHMTRIQFQVNQRPRKSLFVDMYSLEEELDILQRVIRWQSKFCTDLIRVLDPTSFKTTTKGRITHFMSESRYISKILTRLQAREREVIAMQDRTGNLRVQLKQSIEIREESHTKAIRVFTFVTVLFLPLSFVTSFMGMNVSDIRDIDKDQTFFWILALPTTAVVIGLAYIYGYKWDVWKERAGSRAARPTTELDYETATAAFTKLLVETLGWNQEQIGDAEQGLIRRRETGMSLDSVQPPKRKKFWPTLGRTPE